MEEASEKFKFSLTHTNSVAKIKDKTTLLRFLKDHARDVELSDKAIAAFFSAFVSVRSQAALDTILSTP